MDRQSLETRRAASLVLLAAFALSGCPKRDDAPATGTAAATTGATPAPEPGHGNGRDRARRNAGFNVPLLVFAASSLRDAMQEIGPAFTASGRPVVEFNFAGSNVLEQQLESSDRGEVFLSADERTVDALAAHQVVAEGTKTHFLSNTLSIVAHPTSTYTLTDPSTLGSLGFAHLSMADSDAVPAGRYAKAYLSSLTTPRGTVWDAVQARVAPAADVRAALAVVAAQADVVGVVYRSDARAAAVRTLYEVPPASLPTPVAYYAVAVARRARIPLATAFVQYLTTPQARAVFERHGFLAPVAAPQPAAIPAPPPAPPTPQPAP